MRTVFVACVLLAAASPATAQETAAPSTARAQAAPSQHDQERFLRDARVLIVKDGGKGVTGTRRATLSDGALRHDASVQTIDVTKTQFQTPSGTELGFRDYWGYNVAAYRLGRLIGLDMIPPSVARSFQTQQAAFTWWIDDVILDEGERIARRIDAPDPARWTMQMHAMRVFDELIANVDRNRGNLLIDSAWRVWLIDHTRAFRTTTALREPRRIVRCARPLLDGMRALTLEVLTEHLGAYLTRTQMTALLARRDRLVQRLESLGVTAIHDEPLR